MMAQEMVDGSVMTHHLFENLILILLATKVLFGKLLTMMLLLMQRADLIVLGCQRIQALLIDTLVSLSRRMLMVVANYTLETMLKAVFQDPLALFL